MINNWAYSTKNIEWLIFIQDFKFNLNKEN